MAEGIHEAGYPSNSFDSLEIPPDIDTEKFLVDIDTLRQEMRAPEPSEVAIAGIQKYWRGLGLTGSEARVLQFMAILDE
jgi:hypothetical protein